MRVELSVEQVVRIFRAMVAAVTQDAAGGDTAEAADGRQQIARGFELAEDLGVIRIRTAPHPMDDGVDAVGLAVEDGDRAQAFRILP